MSRRTLPTTPHIGLSHVGHTLDEDLPRINDNYEKIDAQLAQAFEERGVLRLSISEANDLLGQQVDEKLQAERTKNAEKTTKLLNAVNRAIKGVTTQQENFSAKVQQKGESLEKNLTDHTSLRLEDGVHDFPKGKEGQMLTIKDGKLVFEYTYPLCEVKTWRHPTLKAGFVPAQGGLIENAKELYPDAWEYLQTEEGKLLCVTEDEWQDMIKAVWATLADGTEVGWNGVGGAPFYVQDLDAGTLRVPDLRGMYAEASGFDGLKAGGHHGDMTRKIYAETIPTAPDNYNGLSGSSNWHWYEYNPEFLTKGGAFSIENEGSGKTSGDSGGSHMRGRLKFDSSRVVPTGNANKPRAWGALVCVFLGTPQPISEAEHDANS